MRVINRYDILESVNDSEFALSDVKGLTQMQKEDLYNYAEELVGIYGKFKDDRYELTLDMLPKPIQYDLCRIFIESIDREIENACFGNDESINNDYLCAMLAMLESNTAQNRERFAKITQKNLLNYYRENLNNLLDNACESYFLTYAENEGLRSVQDPEHGDIFWI